MSDPADHAIRASALVRCQKVRTRRRGYPQLPQATAGRCRSRVFEHQQSTVRERSLKRFGFIPRCTLPYISFLLVREDHRHGPGVDRAHLRVRLRRQEGEQVDSLKPGLDLANRDPVRDLDAREEGKRLVSGRSTTQSTALAVSSLAKATTTRVSETSPGRSEVISWRPATSAIVIGSRMDICTHRRAQNLTLGGQQPDNKAWRNMTRCQRGPRVNKTGISPRTPFILPQPVWPARVETKTSA